MAARDTPPAAAAVPFPDTLVAIPATRRGPSRAPRPRTGAGAGLALRVGRSRLAGSAASRQLPAARSDGHAGRRVPEVCERLGRAIHSPRPTACLFGKPARRKVCQPRPYSVYPIPSATLGLYEAQSRLDASPTFRRKATKARIRETGCTVPSGPETAGKPWRACVCRRPTELPRPGRHRTAGKSTRRIVYRT